MNRAGERDDPQQWWVRASESERPEGLKQPERRQKCEFKVFQREASDYWACQLHSGSTTLSHMSQRGAGRKETWSVHVLVLMHVCVHLFGSLHGITGGVSDLWGRFGVDLIVELKQKINISENVNMSTRSWLLNSWLVDEVMKLITAAEYCFKPQ